MSLESNLSTILNNVRQSCEKVGRNHDEITIIGVTKYVTIERAQEAVDKGIKHLGENRLEGLLEKQQSLSEDPVWHFIGSLQSRKVKDLIDIVYMIHSLDRLSLAKEIHKRANQPIDCFVQVNTSGEESKHGLHPDDVHSFIEKLAPYTNVRVVGLMTMAPHVEDEATLRSTFSKLRMLKDEIMAKQLDYAPCSYLSMGMSNDYQIAIEEGATHIRIGTKLVGSK
ncbi:YggS family pyridoxal phosphate-dependent enzyme [Radiobacillus kanasensis]|uniref:YggS family pyridoxal phosphate-dependent enzyme n=1 Tax=Radiobacillus kanasensis TaxID=2844358 RepID=UPI001E656FDA|nr:YggS family pyridoxal phosphate-dependent enzyme [Radiobacillus kanasensis]UFU00957.1 YggS family pyridoxal phosphate-dependent enzyme [Radiobacillus kanasensis]